MAKRFPNLIKKKNYTFKKLNESKKDKHKEMHTETHYYPIVENQGQKENPESSKREMIHQLEEILKNFISWRRELRLWSERTWSAPSPQQTSKIPVGKFS